MKPDDERSLQLYFIDDHGSSRTRSARAHSPQYAKTDSRESSFGNSSQRDGTNRKREATNDKSTVSWMPIEFFGTANPSKRSCKKISTICPTLIFSLDSMTSFSSHYLDLNENFPFLMRSHLFDLVSTSGCRSEASPFFDLLSIDSCFDEDTTFSQFICRHLRAGCSSTTMDDADGLKNHFPRRAEKLRFVLVG
jgi:hypothetical protein